MEVPKNTKDYILNEIDELDFGVVKVEKNAKTGRIDVVTERRKRFEGNTENKPHKIHKTGEYKKG